MTATLTTTKITAGDVDAAYDEYARVQNLTGTNDPLSEPYYSNTKAAHIRFLRMEGAFLGQSADTKIAFFYGKEALLEAPAPVPAAVETTASTPAKPAVERIRGTVRHLSMTYGLIDYTYGEFIDSVRFSRVMGGIAPRTGMAVEFEIDAFSGQAARVVVVGNAQSEAAYHALLSKPAKVTAKPRPVAPSRKGKRFNPKPSSRIDFNGFLAAINEKGQ